MLNQTTKDWHSRSVTLSEAKGLAVRFFAALRMTLLNGRVAKCTNVMHFDLVALHQLLRREGTWDDAYYATFSHSLRHPLTARISLIKQPHKERRVRQLAKKGQGPKGPIFYSLLGPWGRPEVHMKSFCIAFASLRQARGQRGKRAPGVRLGRWPDWFCAAYAYTLADGVTPTRLAFSVWSRRGLRQRRT